MITKEITVVNRLGLHARAAAQLVRRASTFKSVIKLERLDANAVADAKSILSLLMLAATRGTTLKIVIEGVDEDEALSSIERLFEEGFGESN